MRIQPEFISNTIIRIGKTDDFGAYAKDKDPDQPAKTSRD